MRSLIYLNFPNTPAQSKFLEYPISTHRLPHPEESVKVPSFQGRDLGLGHALNPVRLLNLYTGTLSFLNPLFVFPINLRWMPFLSKHAIIMPLCDKL
jgi:hypothetical protein